MSEYNKVTILSAFLVLGLTGCNLIDITANQNQLLEENSRVTLSSSVNHHEGDIVTYSWTQLGGTKVTLENKDTLNASFNVPAVSEDEWLTFRLTATDNRGLVSSDDVRIKVNKFFDKNIILRVVAVTPEWTSYASTSGWTFGVARKVSPALKYYEVAIWEETASVHLYAFENSYDAAHAIKTPGITDAEKIAYREANMIMKFNNMPSLEADTYDARMARSAFLKDSFIAFTAYMAAVHPDSDHHLVYSGHGSPGGYLFGGQLNYEDAGTMLKSWSSALGRNLGVVDMGGPCNKGSYTDLLNFCQFADYYIASPLPNGGDFFDKSHLDKRDETDPELQYHNLFATGTNLLDILTKRIDLIKEKYKYSESNMVRDKIEQGSYIYNCAAVPAFNTDFEKFIKGKYDYSHNDDLLSYMQQKSAPVSLIAAFDNLILHSIDSKDFFEWTTLSNGLLMPILEVPQEGLAPVSGLF